MKRFSITICFFALASTIAFAQLSPRSTTPTTGSIATTPQSAPAAPGNFINTRTVNGITLQLKRVKGNSADQTVTLEFVVNNPKGNAQVKFDTGYAIDFEGDKYEWGGTFFDEKLYTDVPRKASIGVNKIPSKVKSLALFKFGFYSEHTNQWVEVEYRNLNVEW